MDVLKILLEVKNHAITTTDAIIMLEEWKRGNGNALSDTNIDDIIQKFDAYVKKRRKKTGVAYMNKSEMREAIRKSIKEWNES